MDTLGLLLPLQKSHAENATEAALQAVFIKTYIELLGNDLAEIFDYSVPHMGNANVVERFTKNDGLVVLRRPEVSEKLMRVIYATWKSVSSRRGLAFLEFVLNMLYPNQYTIQRIFHPKKRAEDYPSRITYSDSAENFLTSRIHVSLDESVNLKELSELAPTLNKLVPANVVPSIAVSIGSTHMALHTAIGFQTTLVANFSPSDW